MTIPLQIKLLPHFKELPLPFYATTQSAGMDLSAALDVPYVLKPLERFLISTGLSLAFPPGFEGQIRPRSGLAFKHGITVLNAPGTTDADYRGEIKVLLINLGHEPFTITRGLRIAQFVLKKFEQAEFQVVTAFSETEFSEIEAGLVQRTGGFGSTGQ